MACGEAEPYINVSRRTAETVLGSLFTINHVQRSHVQLYNMKAIVDYPARRMDLGRIQPESYKIKKISHQETEMQELYYKLKELVPNCADKNKMSKTELLQNVIDYIFDLQDTLEIDDTETSREPLAENFQGNQMEAQVNTLTNLIICTALSALVFPAYLALLTYYLNQPYLILQVDVEDELSKV